MRKPGRTMVKLAALLNEALPDVVLYPEDLWYAKGDYKKSLWDCPRWEGLGHIRNMPNCNVCIRSYSTMTNCVRYGIDITRDRLCDVEVDQKSPKAKNPKQAAAQKW